MEKRLKGSKEKKHLNGTKIFKNTWTVQKFLIALERYKTAQTGWTVQYFLRVVQQFK